MKLKNKYIPIPVAKKKLSRRDPRRGLYDVIALPKGKKKVSMANASCHYSLRYHL